MKHQEAAFPYRGTCTALPDRHVQPTTMVRMEVAEAKKGIVPLPELPSDAHRALSENGSRLKESEAVAEVLVPIYDPQAGEILRKANHLVIPSRWLDVYQEVEKEAATEFVEELRIPHGMPKFRWIRQGFKDGAALRLSRSVAAGEQHELLCVLQVLVDNAWLGFCGDIAAAFTQANMELPQSQRLEKVCVKVPGNRELPFLGVDYSY